MNMKKESFIVKANVHLGFNCRNLEKSVQFYKEILGCKEIFTIRYGDLIPKNDPKRLASIPEEQLQEWERLKDVKWIVYLEWTDGYYIELFNEVTAHVEKKVDAKNDYGYTHFAFVVEDIIQFRQSLVDKGAEACIDIEPQPSIDGNYIMWFHDPDGNRIEVQQYTELSAQITGRLRR